MYLVTVGVPASAYTVYIVSTCVEHEACAKDVDGLCMVLG